MNWLGTILRLIMVNDKKVLLRDRKRRAAYDFSWPRHVLSREGDTCIYGGTSVLFREEPLSCLEAGYPLTCLGPPRSRWLQVWKGYPLHDYRPDWGYPLPSPIKGLTGVLSSPLGEVHGPETGDTPFALWTDKQSENITFQLVNSHSGGNKSVSLV